MLTYPNSDESSFVSDGPRENPPTSVPGVTDLELMELLLRLALLESGQAKAATAVTAAPPTPSRTVHPDRPLLIQSPVGRVGISPTLPTKVETPPQPAVTVNIPTPEPLDFLSPAGEAALALLRYSSHSVT